MVSAGRHQQAGDQSVVPVDGAGAGGCPGPPQVQRAAAAGPGAVRFVQVGEPVSAETGPRGQGDPYRGVAFDGDDAAQQDRTVRVTGERQGFPAFDDAVVGDPAAAPDHAALFVEAAPDEPVHRGDEYPPGPPSSAAKTASLSHRGAHIQTMSPRGPSTAPRSPSASRA